MGASRRPVNGDVVLSIPATLHRIGELYRGLERKVHGAEEAEKRADEASDRIRDLEQDLRHAEAVYRISVSERVKMRSEVEQLETRCSRLSRELADAHVHIKVAIWTIAVISAFTWWGWIV